MRTLVVIPAWNEATTVADVIDELGREQPGLDVLVVDDGSTDATAAVASGAGATVLRLPFNLGIGGALRAGFRYARRHGYGAVVQVDADGQHVPSWIPALLEGLETADLVIGARFAGRGDYDPGVLRGVVMRSLARVLSRVADTPLTDTTSGFRAIGPRALELFATRYPLEYLDSLESLATAARAGLVVRQVPVEMRERAGGTPSQGPVRLVTSLARAVLVVALALTRRRESA